MKVAIRDLIWEQHIRHSSGCKYNGANQMHLSVLFSVFCHVFIIDIDECEIEEGNCSHGCHNTLGSFVCVCNTAYELGSDGKQCYSEFKPTQYYHTALTPYI